jgi:hypothetical protein
MSPDLKLLAKAWLGPNSAAAGRQGLLCKPFQRRDAHELAGAIQGQLYDVFRASSHLGFWL